MWEKIPYHDWNDWINLWKIEIKPIILKNIQNDLELMKLALKKNILVELDWRISEIRSIFEDNEILLENDKLKIWLYLEKFKSEDFFKLITYKEEIFDISKEQIKDSILFSQNEKKTIFTDMNILYILIEEINNKINTKWIIWIDIVGLNSKKIWEIFEKYNFYELDI